MNDDDLLHALADEARRERAREEAALDERWDRLAAGSLTAAEAAELAAWAGAEAEPGMPAAGALDAAENDDADAGPDAAAVRRAAYEAFRPLGVDFQQRVVQALQAAAAAERATAVAASRPQAPWAPDASAEVPGPAALRGPAAAAPPGRVLPFGRRWVVWGGAGAAAAAAAAVVVLAIGVRPALPDYAVELQAGEAQLRGEPTTAPGPAADVVLRAGDALAVAVSPGTAVTVPVEARWFAARQGEAVHRLRGGEAERSPSGAVRLQGTVGQDLALPPGRWSLWVMVGRVGALPGSAVLGGAGAEAPGWSRRERDWIAWRVAGLRVEGGGAGSP